MLEKVIVSEDDFTGTYYKGLEIKEKYEKALGLLNQGKCIIAVADMLKIPEMFFTENGTKPRYLRGLANVKGFIPLTYGHKKFDLINKLASWGFNSGSISSRFKLCLNNRFSRMHVIDDVLYDLNLNFTGTINGYELCGDEFGRILYAMGVPKRTKAEADIKLPHYIDNLIDVPGVDGIFCDYATMIFYTRFNNGRVELHEFEDGSSKGIQKAEDFGLKNLRILQRGFPGLGLNESCLEIDCDAESKVIRPVIVFSDENLRRLSKHYYGLDLV